MLFAVLTLVTIFLLTQLVLCTSNSQTRVPKKRGNLLFRTKAALIPEDVSFASEANILRLTLENIFFDFLCGLSNFNGRKETHLFAAVNPLRRPPAVPSMVDEAVALS